MASREPNPASVRPSHQLLCGLQTLMREQGNDSSSSKGKNTSADGGGVTIERLMNDIAVVGGPGRLPVARAEAVARAVGAGREAADEVIGGLGEVVEAAVADLCADEDDDGIREKGGDALENAVASIAGGDGTVMEEIRRCAEKNKVLWRNLRMGDMVSLPRLVDVQWNVSTTVAAGGTAAAVSSLASSAVGVPTAVLSLTVEGEQRHVGACPPRQREVSFEVTQSSVNSLLVSLNSVKESLGGFASVTK